MRKLLAALVGIAMACSVEAQAEEQLPPLSIIVRDTLDIWAVPRGVSPGLSVLNKLQVSGSVNGDGIGAPGWSAHAQLFRFDGQQLSDHIGDIQTADSIEAVPLTRLFEAWIGRQWGDKNRSLALRLGLIDLNGQFDTTDVAGLFVNSSHGIGPDLSRSGSNGPSIYPVSALGTTITVVPNRRVTLRAGIFDGVPGDPARPRAFVAQRLGGRDGILGIAQLDYQLSTESRVELGAWRYSSKLEGIDGDPARDEGVYASLEAPLPGLPRTSMWIRLGIAEPRAQMVTGYMGLGLVRTGLLPERKEDRLGLAIAHAIVRTPSAEPKRPADAETSFEGSYQLKLSERFAAQPDVQYIIHPAGAVHARSALSLGLRFIVTTGWPAKPQATQDSDPTLPPDGAPSVAPQSGARADSQKASSGLSDSD